MPIPFSIPCAMALAAAAPADEGTRIELLALDVEGLDVEAFEDALATRLPGRARVPAGDPRARAGTAWGYVLVRPVDTGWSLALILADGRGYYRAVQAHEGGAPARLVANTLANLIASVEEDALPPDEEHVVVPDAVTETEPDPVPPKVKPDVEPDPDPDPPPQPRPELGISVGGLALWALASPAPSGFAGAGADLQLHARFPRGLVVGGGLGALGRRRSTYGLTRTRVAVHAGYGLSRTRFELLALGGVRVEPWFLRTASGPEPVRAGAQERDASAVLGGFAQLSAGVVLRPGPLRLRLGPTVRLAGSSALGNGGGVARVLRQADSGPRALFRIGGLEVETGLDLTVWWTLGPRSSAGR